MNLGQIIDRCGSILDYAPSLTSYRHEVRDIVNMVYLEMFGERPFQFAQKTVKVKAYSDITAANAITLHAGTNKITAVGTFASYMEGMVLAVTGSTTATNNGEYIIRHIDGASDAYVENEDESLPVFTADATTGNPSLGVKVKHRYIDLPQDCIQPLAVGIRQPGNAASQPIEYLTMFLDEALNLDLDEVSKPTEFIHMSPMNVLGPPRAPNTAIAGAGANVPDAGAYDAVYTVMNLGRESSPSPVAPFSNLTTANKLQINTMLVQEINSGRVKKIYVRGPVSDAFYYVGQVDEATTSIDVTLASSPSYLTDRNTYPKLPENDGLYSRIRMYPRQDSDYDITVRYLYRPEKLLDESDVPALPAGNHIYLVYRTCQELFSKHANVTQSQFYQMKADRELQNIINRHLSQKTAFYVKGPFRAGSMFNRPMPVLTHS